jgi:hypothetical protein
MHLYLCEYLNPRHLVQPVDPSLVIRVTAGGRAYLERDETITVDPEDLKPRREEVRSWKFGITTQSAPQKRSRFYVDTLVWEEFDDDTCKTIEKILRYINPPFFNPEKIPGEGGEWVSMRIPAPIVTEFVMTEVEFARSNPREALQRRHELCRGFYFHRDYAFGYWSPAWNPPRISPVTGEPLYAELWDRRDDYIRRVSEWWQAVPRDKPEPMW